MSGSNVADINTRQTVQSHGGNGNGSNYGERLARIETRLDSIEKHGASREDIVSMENKILKWLVGTVIAASGVLVMAGFMLAKAIAS